MLSRRISVSAAVVLTTVLLAGCAVNEQGDVESDLRGTLDGSGSSAQGSAQDVWVADFQRLNAGVTVNYDPAGSGAGREAFISGGADFAGSDSSLTEDEVAGSLGSCVPGSEAINLPLYVSPLAVAFNVDGVDELNLDAATIAHIFRGDILRWDDQAIAALNPTATLPDAPITAVHRSDDSGTTMNFTDYLFQVAPDVWDSEPADTFPYPTGEAAQGNSGVVSAVRDGRNTIGYADASRTEGLGVVALQVGDDFVLPTAEAAAAIAAISPRVEGRGEHDIAIAVDRTSEEEGVYPLILISYVIACQEYLDENAGLLVRSYLSGAASESGQQAAADAAGSAPLAPALREDVLAAIETIR
ncbi:MAG: phosphate ABC transporter substrate-binding protein PstS [Rhodoglobus sp.]